MVPDKVSLKLVQFGYKKSHEVISGDWLAFRRAVHFFASP